MNTRLAVFLFLLTACISGSLIIGMRKSAIRGGFVVLWLVICAALASLPFLEHAYKILSTAMGFNYASDMLTMFSILFFFTYAFYLTVKLLRVNDSTELLLSRFAILEAKCEELEQKLRTPSERMNR